MVTIWPDIFVLLTGLVTGSFLNCVIFRLAGRASFLKGRSKCPKCQHSLAWTDLVPVLSYIILGGKCRYCKRQISWQYPMVEITTALLFLLIFNFQFSIFKTISLWVIACFLTIIFVYDLKHYLIPDKVIYPAIVITFLYRLCEIIFNFQFSIFKRFSIFNFQTILSGFGAAIFFLIIVFVSRGKWMGVGDIKLAFLMGLVLGWPNILVALFLAFLSGALVGLFLIVAKRKTMKSEVPFGPFLVAGTFVAMFWGASIINWYWALILIR